MERVVGFQFAQGGFVAFFHGFVVQAIWSRLTGGPRGVMANMRDKAEDYAEMERLITAGQVKAIVGMSVPLEKAAEAYAAGERGGTVGKIVLTM